MGHPFHREMMGLDVDMPGALVADEICLGQTFTSVAVAMLCKLVTGQVVIGLPQFMLWGNTLEEWVILAPNNIPGNVGEEREWYPLQRLNLVPSHLFEIQSTPPHGHPALMSAIQPILVVTLPGVAETFKSVIDQIKHGTNFKLVNLLDAENANLTNEYLNTSIEEPENCLNSHFVSYDTLTSRGKPSGNGYLSYCRWSLGFFNAFHRCRTKHSVGWQIGMNKRIRFKLQVAATPGFYSLYDWCYQTMWQFSGAPADPVYDSVMEKNCAES